MIAETRDRQRHPDEAGKEGRAANEAAEHEAEESEKYHADVESGYKSISCWFALYFPAPCLPVLHGFRRLMLPNCCQVFLTRKNLSRSAA